RFSADAKQLYLSTQSKNIHTFDVATGKELYSFEPGERLNDFAVSRDSTLLADVGLKRDPKPNPNANPNPESRRCWLQLLRLPSKEPVWQFQVEVAGSASGDLCLSPDQQLLAMRL